MGMTRTHTSIYAWPLDKPLPRSLHEHPSWWPHDYEGIDGNRARKPTGVGGHLSSKVYHNSHQTRQRRHNRQLCDVGAE